MECQFEPVNQKITGTIRENSLYYFIKENPGCLTNFTIQESNTDSREVLYIKPNRSSFESSYFQGIESTQAHLSIDKLFSRENARHADGFGPAHWTVSYGDFRLHVYFNEKGNILNAQVRKDSNGSYIELSKSEQSQIFEQARPIQALLEKIISQKKKTYYNLSLDLGKTAEELLKAPSVETCLHLGSIYFEIIEKMNRYSSDTIRTQQGVHIQRYIEQKRAELTKTTEDEAAVVAYGRTTSQQPIEKKITSSSTPPKPLSRKNTKLETLKTQLESVIQAIKTRYEHDKTPPGLIPLLHEVDTLSLDITLVSKHTKADNQQKIQKYLKNKKAQLPITLQGLSEEFETRIYYGDIEYIEKYHDCIHENTQLGPVFFRFMDELAKTPSNNELHQKQLAIIEYLYEHSELYRSALSLKCSVINTDENFQNGFGLLASCFLNENFTAFAMFIKHGALTQTNQILWGGQYLSILQALILLYPHPKTPDVLFVQELISRNISLILPPPETGSDILSLESVRLGGHKQTLRKLKPSNINKQIQAFMEEEHALKAAVPLYACEYPELIALLAKHTKEPIVLFEVLSILVTNGSIITRSVVDPTGKVDLFLLFIPNEKAESSEKYKENLLKSLKCVQETARETFRELGPKMQRVLIEQLQQKAQTENWKTAYCLLKSALFAYTLLEGKTYTDDTRAYAIYSQMVRLIKPHHPEISEQEAVSVRIFLTGICAREKRRSMDNATIKAPEISVFDSKASENTPQSPNNMKGASI